MTIRLISVILPIHNQADHIDGIVAEYSRALDKIPHSHEIILAVNGSRDSSLEVCQSISARNSCVRVVHSQRSGWGLAVKLGLAEAAGDLLCYTNSARTSPEDLLLMLLYASVFPTV